MPPSEPIEQPSAGPSAQLTARPPISRRTACSGARFSELKRAFGDDASNGNWWDRRSGAGLEYLSGRSIESFPLLRPLPEFPLAGPSGEVLDRLMRLFEPELVKRMPNGVTCNVAACVDAEHALRGANTGATAYLCGHIDNFCQKSVRFLLLFLPYTAANVGSALLLLHVSFLGLVCPATHKELVHSPDFIPDQLLFECEHEFTRGAGHAATRCTLRVWVPQHPGHDVVSDTPWPGVRTALVSWAGHPHRACIAAQHRAVVEPRLRCGWRSPAGVPPPHLMPLATHHEQCHNALFHVYYSRLSTTWCTHGITNFSTVLTPPFVSCSNAVWLVQGWNLAGRDTWIGATDAAAFLRFLGFEAVLVEFSSPEAQRARAEALAALENIQTARTQGLSVEAARLEGGLHALWVNAGCVPPSLPYRFSLVLPTPNKIPSQSAFLHASYRRHRCTCVELYHVCFLHAK